MPKSRTEIVEGVLLSVMLVTSLLIVFSLHAASSNINTTTKAPGVLKASGSFTLTTYPIADAYVQEGYPDTNYGTQTRIIARSCDTGTGSLGQMRGFLKFDISSIPAGATIMEAKLRLHCYYITEYIKNVSDVQIRQVTDDSWVETSINWTNQPAYGSVCSNIILLDNDSWAGNHPVDNWYENDVTSFVKNQFDNGDTTISLMIRCMQEYYDNLYYRGSYYNSKEAALENRPTLIVTYEQSIEHGVSVNVAPDTKDNLQGSVSSFVVTVTNTGSHQENYVMTIGDNGNNWGLILSGDNLTVDNKLENVSPGSNRTLTLAVAIPDNATIGTLDNIWIKATSVDNENVTDYGYCIVRCTDEIKSTADLVAGWNLVSFTVTSESSTWDSIFDNQTYYMWRWSAENKKYVSPSSTAPVELGVGYWIWVGYDQTVTTSGVPVDNYSINLVTGWNLVGFPVTSPKTTPDNLFPGQTYYIWRWSAVNKKYVSPPDNQPVEIKIGYWICVDHDQTVTVPL